jgi:protein TonB
VLALIVSLLLHLLPLVSELIAQTPAPLPPAPAPMAAQLRPPPPAQQAPLTLPEQAPPKAAPAKAAQPDKKLTTAGKPDNWQAEVRRQFKKLDERDLFYPADAIAQGQEGEVLVLLLLDQAGNSIAARVEQSSGYPSLDSAALRAARSLRSLPADAPRETLIPVRYRLR